MGQDSEPCAGTASLATRVGNDLWFVDFGQFQCLAKGLEGCRGIGLTGKSLALQAFERLALGLTQAVVAVSVFSLGWDNLRAWW